MQSDSEALLKALLDDTIDIIASDHSPNTSFEKSTDFGSAPPGVSGLETTVPVIFDRFISKGIFGWDLLIRKYADAPRQLVGREKVSVSEGQRAAFFVFDPQGETKFEPAYFKTKSPISPFLGDTVKGAIRQTVFFGK